LGAPAAAKRGEESEEWGFGARRRRGSPPPTRRVEPKQKHTHLDERRELVLAVGLDAEALDDLLCD
jgi:hypothetical protein